MLILGVVVGLGVNISETLHKLKQLPISRSVITDIWYHRIQQEVIFYAKIRPYRSILMNDTSIEL